MVITLFSYMNDMLFYWGLILTLDFNYCVLLLQTWESVVDTTALLRSCVQSAVAMLRDQVESGLRSTRRVEILLALLSDNDEITGSNKTFFSTCCCFFCFLLLLMLIILSEFVRWIPTSGEAASSLIVGDSRRQHFLIHQEQLGLQGGLKHRCLARRRHL